MKRSLLLRALGPVLASGMVATGLIIPAKKASADTGDSSGKDPDSNEHAVILDDEDPHDQDKLLISTKGVDLTKDTSSLSFDCIQVEKVDVPFDENLYLVTPDPDVDTLSIESTYDPSTFNYIEYDYLMDLGTPVADAFRSGEEENGYQFEYMRCPEAWDLIKETPHRKVRVAIIDMGVDFTHPEFEGVLNQELSYDAYRESALTSAAFGAHGTHVAGILGAKYTGEADNCRGVASGYDNDIIEMLSLNVFTEAGKGKTSACARAISYAIENNCEIINMSFGSYKYTNTMASAVRYAYQNGCILCAAAGNDRTSASHFPSDYAESIGVISTYAFSDPTVNRGDTNYTNFGTHKNITAIGTRLYSTAIGGYYSYMSGTSMATPCVTGIVAMMLSINPDLTPMQIKLILQDTAQDLYTPGYDIYTGYGLVDAYACVREARDLFYGNPEENDSPEADFVQRVYTSVFERLPDEKACSLWTEQLKSGATCADVALEICASDEADTSSENDTEYISMLYRALLNREPDQDGLYAWKDYLEQGYSRQGLVCQFIESEEFRSLCSLSGLSSGSASFENESDRNQDVTRFLQRLYGLSLGRPADNDGLNFWCKEWNSGKRSAEEIVDFFFNSEEYLSFARSNEDYLKDLYLAFFGRQPDDSGFAFWQDKLNEGMSREWVLSCFSDSEEFLALLSSFGLS